MDEPEVMLIFPPVVYSNFGRYYPSTAALASYLEANGVKTAQDDLNQTLLESLVGPQHLNEVMATQEETLSNLTNENDNLIFNPSLRKLLAARALTAKPDCFRDQRGRVLPAGHPKVPLEILSALSNSYYMDLSLAELVSPKFWQLPQTRAFESYLKLARVCDRIPSSAHTVGISIPMGPQLACALILARTLKEELQIHVVIGGPTITLLDDHDLTHLLTVHRSIDAAVRYQGEVPLLNLVRHFAAGENEPWQVPGVLAVCNNGLSKTPLPLTLPKLSHLPFAHYEPELLDNLATPEISVRQAEGCYWGQCAYCDYVELYPKSAGRYRPQSVAKLVQEMKFHVDQHGVNKFCLITESLPPRVGRDMGTAIRELGLDVSWNSFAMVDPGFDVETLKVMAGAGCTSLCIGVETVVDDVLSLVRKRATREMTTRFFENCREAGINLEINLIPNLPTTTRAAALEALEVLERYIDVFVGISIFPFEATRSSAIGRNPEHFGLTVIESVNKKSGQAEFSANHLPVKDPAMNEEDLYHVIGVYRQLAAKVTRKELDGLRPADEENIDENEWSTLTFDERYVMLMLPEGQYQRIGPLLFNWMTGRVGHFPALWDPIIKWLRARGTFQRGEFECFLQNVTQLKGVENEAIADYVIKKLKSEGLLRNDSGAAARPIHAPRSVTPETLETSLQVLTP